MGGNSSVYSINPNLSIWKKIFDLINLAEKDISQLYNEYSCLPVDQYLTIDINKFIDAVGIEDTSFTNRVFTAVDSRHDNNINFGEFVTVLWNFSTLGKDDLATFAFDLYDDNCSGEVSPSSVTQMINDLYGELANQSSDMQSVSLVHKLAHMPGAFTVTSFHDYCQKHPAIVTPIIAIQEKVRRTIMGEGFWRRLTKSREQLKCVMTLSKLRILLLQHNDNRRRKQTTKEFLFQTSIRIMRSFSNHKIHDTEDNKRDKPTRSPASRETSHVDTGASTTCLDP